MIYSGAFRIPHMNKYEGNEETDMKPLSSKTLEKKYSELGLSKEKTDLLGEYFLCFSNLYGVISVRDAWDVFRHYEGVGSVHKRDFVFFSGIVQRESGHPYSILELKEVYSGETTTDPLDRLIVNNKLIRSGYGKFMLIYTTEELQSDKEYYGFRKNRKENRM